MLFRLLALVAVAISVLKAAPPPGGYQCWNFASTDEIRYDYLTVVTNLRKQIAQGNAVCKDQKTCPQGKNIYRLDWDCLLEIEAQKVANQCTENPSLPTGLSALVKKVPMTTCNPKPLFKQTVNNWWNATKEVGLGDPPMFNDTRLGSFAKLAYGKATRIGCAQKNCDSNLYVACMLFPEGPAEGAQIYEVGTGCTNPADCDTYADSKCYDNLCRAGYIDPLATTTTTETTPTTTAETTTEATTTEATTTTSPTVEPTNTTSPTTEPTATVPTVTTTAPAPPMTTTTGSGDSLSTVPPGKL
ncbi:hypothetical protein Aduo_015254 [Ancylostoma duodenale]